MSLEFTGYPVSRVLIRVAREAKTLAICAACGAGGLLFAVEGYLSGSWIQKDAAGTAIGLAVACIALTAMAVVLFSRSRRATEIAVLAVSPHHRVRFDGKRVVVADLNGKPIPRQTMMILGRHRAAIAAVTEFPRATARTR